MKAKNKIRFAVIGSTGMIGSKAVPDAILAADNCELAAVQGLYKDQVEPLAKSWNVPSYTDVEEMLKETDCDAVYVASPQSVHVEHVKLCAENGFHVLCEKPLARSSAEAKEMVSTCKKAWNCF